METISIIEIITNKISYNKKTNVFSVAILDFMFVGNYKKSVRISEILDDIYASLGEVNIIRDDIYFLDFETKTRIHGNTKLKNLNIHKKEKLERKVKVTADKHRSKKTTASESYEVLIEEDLDEFLDVKIMEKEVREENLKDRDDEMEESFGEKKDESKARKKGKSLPPPAPSPASTAPPSPGGGSPARAPAAPPPPPPRDVLAGGGVAPPKPKPVPRITTPAVPQISVYEINMGLQYYSVMMEQRSYLFYVYFSHEELKIVDEEGKVVYKTTFTIVTTKKEPPVLELRIEGEGFEVHPLFGKVEVKKDAVNPPVMIFSILPLKSLKKRKKKREIERRFLNAYIVFEGKTISHTILSIIVQPKFFRLDLGPIHLNLSKKTALIISFISILIAGISLATILLSINPSSNFNDILGGLVPGLGSIIFVAIFLITLFKEGIYPLKEKISSFLNFDQTGVLIK